MSAVAHINGVFDVLNGPGSPFETGEIEVRGQSYTGYTNAPSQVRQLWMAVKADDSAEYLVYEDERLTFGEARDRVLQIANALIDDLGVRTGDPVGLALRNYPEWILGWWRVTELSRMDSRMVGHPDGGSRCCRNELVLERP